jgi:hypothetical protein
MPDRNVWPTLNEIVGVMRPMKMAIPEMDIGNQGVPISPSAPRALRLFCTMVADDNYSQGVPG